MQTGMCLYFDDEISSSDAPLQGMIEILKGRYRLNIVLTDTVMEFETKLRNENYTLIILDIRIKPEMGGGTYNKFWQREGVALLKRIRDGEYEPNTSREIPIIVITAVADDTKQIEISHIGRGGNNQFKFALFEKPADEDEIGKTVQKFIYTNN